MLITQNHTFNAVSPVSTLPIHCFLNSISTTPTRNHNLVWKQIRNYRLAPFKTKTTSGTAALYYTVIVGFVVFLSPSQYKTCSGLFIPAPSSHISDSFLFPSYESINWPPFIMVFAAYYCLPFVFLMLGLY